MQQQSSKQRAGRLAAALVASSFALAVSSAFAGECPADKRVADGQGQKMVTHGAIGVADVVRSSIDLGNEAPMLTDRQFRLRTLAIAPGGIVPWHSHNERPAQIYIVKGEIVDTRATAPCRSCTGPVTWRRKSTARRTGGRTTPRSRCC
jgi:hypothetical protein